MMDKIVRGGALVLAILLVVFTGLMFYSLGNGGNIGTGSGGAESTSTGFLSGPGSASLMFVLSVSAFSLAALLIWIKKPRGGDHEWDESPEDEAFQEDHDEEDTD